MYMIVSLQPLGMTNTHTLGNNMEQMPDASRPYTNSFPIIEITAL